MSSIEENIERVDALIALIKESHMCLRFDALPDRFRVIYPVGCIVDGVQASHAMGKAKALQRIIQAMERHDRASFVH